ncbi:MAG: hypothetical protein KAS01_00770 [Candidatus Pacebacteria bacterium]|nr:hypothetical protein [Candidatus Paceibacterota bacterium]
MLKKIFIFIILLFIIIFVFFLNEKNNLPEINLKNISNLEKIITENILEDIKKTVSNPPPLINIEKEVDSFLTSKGVLKYTNTQRYETESLPPLAQNGKLDEIAMKRLEDMFSEQYFEHISPQGIGASDVAKEVGYEYISIGENIALGNFKDDQILVQAWMDSPGHRANILNNRYTEIGIAVKKGTYENDEVWIGVQIFALPLSACPQPSKILESSITDMQNQITDLQNSIDILQKEIESTRPVSKNQLKAYNKKIDTYNQIVNQMNTLIREQKEIISKYNNQIDLLNECVKG